MSIGLTSRTTVRSKNAGQFWMTIDVICADVAEFERVLASPLLDPAVVGSIYGVDAAEVRTFAMRSLLAIKISLPRTTPQGSVGDRDAHSGQQYIPLVALLER